MYNQAGGKLSVFEFGPKVVEKKARYRDEEERKKLTYNFNTNPRLKRGHNFGVVYVTNASQEDEAAQKRKKEKIFSKANVDSSQLEKKKKLELDIPEPPENRNHVGMNTSPVHSTVRPKPLTFQIGVQTDPYIDRPPSPLFWPEKTGIDQATEIEDGALFDFDVEVEPILNVLLSKVLEQSRMEVLEEEEIREMKEKQRYFEEIRNRELMEVQKLEESETRKRKEMEMRLTQQQQRVTLSKVYQQKLFARTIAKEYIKNLKNNVLTHLMDRGIFRKPIATQYVNILYPFIHKSSESQNKNDMTVASHLDITFKTDYMNKIKNLHKESKEREAKRLKDIEIQNEMARQRKIQEKEQRRLERERKRIEEMLRRIKEELTNIFIKEAEFVDDAVDVFEMNGYYQNKRKNCSIMGGYTGQWVMVLSYFSKKIPDFINQEKLNKILDLFVPKSPVFYLLYKPEDLDYFKTIDANINAIEDIVKTSAANQDVIIEYIMSQIPNHNPILKYFLVELEAAGFDNCKVILQMYLASIMKYLKSTDANLSEKIKFLLKDGTDEYRAVGVLNVTSIGKPKQPAKRNVGGANRNRQVKIEYDPDFYDKAVALNSIVDSNRMLFFNPHYEKMLRHNIIECCNLISKVEPDKDNQKADFESWVDNFSKIVLNQLAVAFNNLPTFEFEVVYQ